jgi:hypothetical protein
VTAVVLPTGSWSQRVMLFVGSRGDVSAFLRASRSYVKSVRWPFGLVVDAVLPSAS